MVPNQVQYFQGTGDNNHISISLSYNKFIEFITGKYTEKI